MILMGLQGVAKFLIASYIQLFQMLLKRTLLQI